MPDEPQKDSPVPLRSIHTAAFGQLLAKAGVSLLVSTYQAGKLVIIRADRAGHVNTHFRTFNRPMGVAVAANRVAVGNNVSILEFHNAPSIAARIDPPGTHDAAYLPRLVHYTGDVHGHEMAFADGELWFVNTRFSCLCTRSQGYSFVPRWTPPFIKAVQPGDRCHLNGMAVVDEKVRYVTALGTTDTPGGWRDNKAAGGVIIDVQSNQIVATGLSMPHSPRWHDGRLWVCSSGTGTVGTIDAGTYRPLAEFPGFTRGLSFHGRYGFVGLSQVRETIRFSGIPIADRPLPERACGVWVFDTQTGAILGFLRFEQAVQEVFAVELVKHRYPDLLLDSPLIAESFFVPPAGAK
jgi:uncharacterized protein (TIGR03032 family)